MGHVRFFILLLTASVAMAGDKYYEKTNIPPGAFIVFDGVDKTGATDITAALITFLQRGGNMIIPDGDYLIAGAGASTGGAYTTITKSMFVECAPKARFIGTNLDHSMIRLIVPSNGSGLPSGGISVIWHGCTFDQTTQKTSTSVPFSGTYTSTNQGTSAVTDGLDVMGDYTGPVAGINYLEVSGATFNGGTHWQNAGSGAGGDSGLFVSGVKNAQIHGNYFFGNRDTALYLSSDATGTLDVRFDIYGNYFKNDFACISVKRSIPGFSIHGNTCINAVIGYASEYIIGAGDSQGEIYGNRCSACQVNERIDFSSNISVHDEKCDNFGAYLADGTTVPATYTATGLKISGTTYSSFRNNSCSSISATYAALNPSFITVGAFTKPDTTVVQSQYNILQNNSSTGFHSIGGEADSADYNEFWENYEYSGSVHYIVAVGSHSSVTRYDYTTGNRIYMNPQLFTDGTAGAPIIARFGDATSGLFFGSGTLDWSVSGTERARLSSSGLGVTAESVSTLGTSLQTLASISPTLQVVGAGAGVSSLLNGRFTADTGAASRYALKSRNTTPGSFTTITTGDCIGKDLYYGDDGTTYNTEVGEIDVCSSGTLGTGQIPGTYFLKLADSTGTLKTPLTFTSSGGVLGVAGTNTGTLGFAGVTSGTVTVQPQSAAGTYNFNLPITAGTSGQPLLSAAGGSSPMTFGTLGIAAGGTGAITAQAATQALSTRYVVCSSGATVSAPADTSEDTLYDCTIPANSLGANGQIIVQAAFTHTSSSNNKVLRIRYSTVSGTVVWTLTDTTTTSVLSAITTIQNKNATGSQESGVNSQPLNAGSSGTYQTEAVDTTLASHVVVTCAKASSGETCSMNRVLVEVVYAP